MSFFKNYFLGKPGQPDYTPDDQPKTRPELFRMVLSVRRDSMVGLNLLYLLCWIPAIFWTFLNLIQLVPDHQAVPFGDLAFTYLLLLAPMIAITGPFTVAAAYVMRNWARDEHSYVIADFGQALRQNWKQGLLLGIINGALPLLVFVCLDFYSHLAGESSLFLLPCVIVLGAALTWVLSAQLLPTMIVTYRQGFASMARNALLMTLAALPKAVLAKLATLVLPLILLLCALIVPSWLNWLSPIVLVFYAVFGLSFNKLITASYANALCEKYLNTKIEGAGVNIGLRSRKDTE